MILQNNTHHVLLTGANGFVASHILSVLIERGFAVTATVRSQSKADDIIKTHPSWQGKINFAIVSDFLSREPFNDLFTNAAVPFTHIIHTASPVKFNVQDIEKEMIKPAVRGTTEILKSAHKYGGPALKRFVLLSSAATVLDSFEDISQEGRPYTEKDWNPVTAQQAIGQKNVVFGYNVSKTEGERTAWTFMETHKPHFDLTVINPVVITGPIIHPVSGPSSINETNHFAIASFIDGTHKTIEDVRFPFWHFVDVRDVARSHVDALTNPAAAGQRIVPIAELLTPQLVVNIVRKNFPSLRDRVPEGNPAQILPVGVHPNGWDTRHSLDILAKGTESGRWEYIALEKSVVDAVQSMIDQKLL